MIGYTIAAVAAFAFFLLTWAICASSAEGDRFDTHNSCQNCGSVTIPGEHLCARCRTAETLAGQTFEELAARNRGATR
jgi:uncharacterized OB-fold protein